MVMQHPISSGGCRLDIDGGFATRSAGIAPDPQLNATTDRREHLELHSL